MSKITFDNKIIIEYYDVKYKRRKYKFKKIKNKTCKYVDDYIYEITDLKGKAIPQEIHLEILRHYFDIHNFLTTT